MDILYILDKISELIKKAKKKCYKRRQLFADLFTKIFFYGLDLRLQTVCTVFANIEFECTVYALTVKLFIRFFYDIKRIPYACRLDDSAHRSKLVGIAAFVDHINDLTDLFGDTCTLSAVV